jgi:hypothetical protein
VGTVKKQKRARKSTLKNRYCAGAKLSEHKFLRILRGFAEGMTLSALEPMTHTSGKTIRATYRLLRARLADAVLDEQDAFGRAGFYLSQPSAGELLSTIAASAAFRRYRKLHAPRLKDQREVRLLVIEFAVRVFCALDLRSVTATPATTLQALCRGISALKARDPLQNLAAAVPGGRQHAFPTTRLYEDLRRHLLRSPLGKASRKYVSCEKPADSRITISQESETAPHAHSPRHLDCRSNAPRAPPLAPAV